MRTSPQPARLCDSPEGFYVVLSGSHLPGRTPGGVDASRMAEVCGFSYLSLSIRNSIKIPPRVRIHNLSDTTTRLLHRSHKSIFSMCY